MLDRDHHERLDELPEIDLAGHGLRDFDYRGEIQVFDQCPDDASRTRHCLALQEDGI
jgi:hypothetical protein